MARDLVAVMRRARASRASTLAGHDRGARCAYRLALDHPGACAQLAVLDIIPTSETYARADMAFGARHWHWFFLPSRYDLPERLIGADPERFFVLPGREAAFDARGAGRVPGAATAIPATIHAICEDYRAGATFDRELDEADRGNRRITCPLLALWAARPARSRGSTC